MSWFPIFISRGNRDWSKITAYIEYKGKNGKIIRKPIQVTINLTTPTT